MGFLQRPFRHVYFHATIYLIAFCGVVFVGQGISGTATYYLALSPAGIIRGHFYWQFITYMFAHGGWSHLLFNMLALFLFGTAVERRMGSAEFLTYYLTTGFLAGVFSFLVFFLTGQNVYLLGASGALFAVQLAYATLCPNSVIYIWGILPLRAPVMVLVCTVIELVLTVTGSASGVAHLTHLAGFGFGWLYFVVRFRFNPARALLRR